MSLSESERIAVLENRIGTVESQLLRTETRLLEVLSDIRDDLKAAIVAINSKHEELTNKNNALNLRLNGVIAKLSVIGASVALLYPYAIDVLKKLYGH